MMVMFYFSGTGNSKYIAELFSENMDIPCYSIEDDVNFEDIIINEETIGFCYPIYFSRIPKILREFISKYMNSLKDKKLIIFCTQQILSGDGTRAFVDLFEKGHIKVVYTEHFFMPSNIFPITTNQEKIRKYVNNSEQKISNYQQIVILMKELLPLIDNIDISLDNEERIDGFIEQIFNNIKSGGAKW